MSVCVSKRSNSCKIVFHLLLLHSIKVNAAGADFTAGDFKYLVELKDFLIRKRFFFYENMFKLKLIFYKYME